MRNYLKASMAILGIGAVIALSGSVTANADVRSADGNLSILASMNVSTTVDVDLVKH